MRMLGFVLRLFLIPASYTALAAGAADPTVCDATVKMNIEEGSTPKEYQSYIGLWSGGWNNERICSGLIIRKIDGNGDAYIDYIYRIAGKNATVNTQSVIGHIENRQTLTFNDKDGSRYTFTLKPGNELVASFLNTGGTKLETSFRRAVPTSAANVTAQGSEEQEIREFLASVFKEVSLAGQIRH